MRIVTYFAGICLGWRILEGKESIIEIADILYMFCPEAPECVLYDFACRLRSVMLSRETSFACRIIFKSDLLHGYRIFIIMLNLSY